MGMILLSRCYELGNLREVTSKITKPENGGAVSETRLCPSPKPVLSQRPDPVLLSALKAVLQAGPWKPRFWPMPTWVL